MSKSSMFFYPKVSGREFKVLRMNILRNLPSVLTELGTHIGELMLGPSLSSLILTDSNLVDK